MRTMFESRRSFHAKALAILIVFALVTAVVGCGTPVTMYSLTIESTAGGEVAVPGEDTFEYSAETVIELEAVADEGHRFVDWTGDVGTLADVKAASTTITINGDYSITANFVAVYDLSISSTDGGSVTTPGEGTFTFSEGAIANLVAVPASGYSFGRWTGDVDTIADFNAASTTISMEKSYLIRARFISAKGEAIGAGTVVKHERSESLPYSYYYYVPVSCLDEPVVGIVLIATAGPNPAISYAQVEQYALEALNLLVSHAEPSGLIMFTVAIPAGIAGVDAEQTGSAQVLHRANFDTAVGMYYRPDLLFLHVLGHFRDLLEEVGFIVDPQIFVTGFSAGGQWAHRFALLYPDLTKAAAPGCTGLWTMPLDSYRGTDLPYHIGVEDLAKLGLGAFDLASFVRIPFLVLIGAEDENDALDCGAGSGCFGLSWEEIVFYKNAFGVGVVERAESFHNTLIELGMDSTFKSYAGVGHWLTEDMKADVISFFSSIPLSSP